MEERFLTEERICAFQEYLIMEEKSTATVEKYIRDVRAFSLFAGDKSISKEVMIAYKKYLEENGYAVRSINSMLASLNSILNYLNWQDCRVKQLKLQKQIYSKEEKELTKGDYMKLLKASECNPRLKLVMQTICSTGIRISELRFFTVEAVKNGEVTVDCKNKNRIVLIPGKLKKLLMDYAKKQDIQSGTIFITKNGNPLNRSNIWAQMKKLCRKAGVTPGKVFPHNLRKLFAKTFYKMEKDIAKLADILGHSSIETTRIYIMTTGMEHRERIEQMGLVV